MDKLEPVVAVAVAVLGALLAAALLALAVLCYRRCAAKNSTLFHASKFSAESILVYGQDGDPSGDWADLELDDVKLAPQIRKILNDTQWVDDATGLIPHSLGILKLCHSLTERLLVPAFAGRHKDRLHQIIQLSRRVSPRIDDVASAMYPPLDPRLLEARCSALVMALHLLVCHSLSLSLSPSLPTTPKTRQQHFVLNTLNEMERHLAILRYAAMSHETVQRVFREEEIKTEDEEKEGEARFN